VQILGRTTSFNVQKVLWLLDELNLSYEHIELGGRFGGLDSDKFIKLNPMQKVPLLMDGEKVIWESHTILRYLAACYGKEKWGSNCPYERSLYERWLDWSQVIFQLAFMGVFWGYYRMPPSKRNMIAINHDLDKCVECLNILEQQLSNTDYLIGSSISLADISIGAILFRLTELGLEVELPTNVTKWYEKLRKRPGYQKWVMSDFSELEAREDF